MTMPCDVDQSSRTESSFTQAIFFRFFETLWRRTFEPKVTRDVVSTAKASGKRFWASMPETNLFDTLQCQILVLTPNDRLASRCRRVFRVWADTQDRVIYAPPTFISFNQWVRDQWRLGRYALPLKHHLAGRWRVLSDAEEWVIWHKLVSQTEGLDLMDTCGLAQLAQEAYRIQCHWCMKTREVAAHATGDQEFYVRWLREFRRLCASVDVLTLSEVLSALVDLPGNTLARYSSCCWLGFSELTPAETRVFEAMPHVWGTTPYRLSLGECISKEMVSANQLCGQWSAEDETSELQQAIHWMGQRYSTNVKLALVVPDLPTRKYALEREWVEQWAARYDPSVKLALPDASLEGSPLAEWLNLSGGTRLVSLPMYGALSSLLMLTQGRLDRDAVRILLTSPYIAGFRIERCARWRLWERLSVLQQREWLLSNLYREWSQAGLGTALSACPIWKKALEQSISVRDASMTMSYMTPQTAVSETGAATIGGGSEEVVSRLDALLALWGWPGDEGLDSVEYQQLKRWKSVREQWQAMLVIRERLGDSISTSEASRYLSELFKTQLFQPQSQETPIQVLGILEALEQPFDALWVLGASSESLPAVARPHPLLPITLQKQYNSLRATPARELSLAREIVRVFQVLNGEVCFSWPKRVGDREMSPSRLIAALPDWSALARESCVTGMSSVGNEKLGVETVHETHASPIADASAVKGGTGLLKTFAECPFKAFLRYRLGLEYPMTEGLGLGPLERGVLVHGALESIWKRLGDHEALVRFAADDLEALVQEHVQKTVHETRLPPGLFLGEALLANETHRLTRLILAWLALDKQREPFRVAAVESTVEIPLAGMTLTLRIDRLDETRNGDLLIMDYKTGMVDVGQWYGKRLQAPQLPLYCVALLPRARGVLFAVVKADKPALKGIVANDVGVMLDPKKARGVRSAENWSQQTAVWQQTLTQSAQDYVKGLSVIDPIEGMKTCERCGFHRVCRIQERIQLSVSAIQTSPDTL